MIYYNSASTGDPELSSSSSASSLSVSEAGEDDDRLSSGFTTSSSAEDLPRTTHMSDSEWSLVSSSGSPLEDIVSSSTDDEDEQAAAAVADSRTTIPDVNRRISDTETLRGSEQERSFTFPKMEFSRGSATPLAVPESEPPLRSKVRSKRTAYTLLILCIMLMEPAVAHWWYSSKGGLPETWFGSNSVKTAEVPTGPRIMVVTELQRITRCREDTRAITAPPAVPTSAVERTCETFAGVFDCVSQYASHKAVSAIRGLAVVSEKVDELYTQHGPTPGSKSDVFIKQVRSTVEEALNAASPHVSRACSTVETVVAQEVLPRVKMAAAVSARRSQEIRDAMAPVVFKHLALTKSRVDLALQKAGEKWSETQPLVLQASLDGLEHVKSMSLEVKSKAVTSLGYARKAWLETDWKESIVRMKPQKRELPKKTWRSVFVKEEPLEQEESRFVFNWVFG